MTTYCWQKSLHFSSRKDRLALSFMLLKIMPQHSLTRETCSRSYRNNSAADCSISLKFSTEFQQVTSDTLHTIKVKGQRSKMKVTGSQVKVTINKFLHNYNNICPILMLNEFSPGS